MSAGIAMYLLGLFSALLSLCLSIEQVFIEPIPLLNFIWGVSSLWSLTFVCIGIGLIIDKAGDD